MTSWTEDKFVGSEESMMRVVGSSVLTENVVQPWAPLNSATALHPVLP